MLAFSFGFDGSTLTLTQTADDGAITVNKGIGGAFQVVALNLHDGTNLASLFVNFGGSSDTFHDEFFGNYPFPASFWNQ